MTSEELISYYPRLYHMAEPSAYASIKKYGLLSTSALLDLLSITGEERYRIESAHRPEKVPIASGSHRVIIRDQKPLRPAALKECLTDMSERAWYELLNRKVFFWPREERLLGLLRARAYRSDEQLVLIIPTRKLIAAHESCVTLSPINSGSTLYNPPKRSSATFQPISTYPFAERRRKAAANAVAEVAVEHGVPLIAEILEEVRIVKNGETVKVLVP